MIVPWCRDFFARPFPRRRGRQPRERRPALSAGRAAAIGRPAQVLPVGSIILGLALAPLDRLAVDLAHRPARDSPRMAPQGLGFPVASQASQLVSAHGNTVELGRRGDANHERISVRGGSEFSQQRLTSFYHYESAWRTANTGSNPVGATTELAEINPAISPESDASPFNS